MYSMVMMMAMASAPADVDFGRGCKGCSGCWSGCNGCWSSCHGCGGCHGCWSSCHGCGGCHGCWSSCKGCSGGFLGMGLFSKHSCHGCGGCHGCWSSCHGCGGCHGCWSSCHGCGGCYGGCHGCYGYPEPGPYASSFGGLGVAAPVMGAPVYAAPAVGTTTPPVTDKTDEPMKGNKDNKGTEGTALPAQANVVVELPADAKLYADGQLTKLTSGTRSFVTPELAAGKRYHYELKVEFSRDGKVVSEVKRVVVKAGEETRVRFDEAEMVAAAK